MALAAPVVATAPASSEPSASSRSGPRTMADTPTARASSGAGRSTGSITDGLLGALGGPARAAAAAASYTRGSGRRHPDLILQPDLDRGETRRTSSSTGLGQLARGMLPRVKLVVAIVHHEDAGA